MKIGIIVGCYTEFLSLKQCLLSINSQNIRDKIVVVGINNGKDKDMVRKIMDVYAPLLKRNDKYIEYKEPVGIYKWWNDGILKSLNCNYIGIINDDITIPESGVETIIDALAKSGYDMLWPDTVSNKYNTQAIPPPYSIEDSNMDGWCFFCPTKTYLDYGLFDEAFQIYGGDSDYFYYLKDKDVKTGEIKNVKIFHQGSASLNKARHELGGVLFGDRNLLRKKWTKKSIWTPYQAQPLKTF